MMQSTTRRPRAGPLRGRSGDQRVPRRPVYCRDATMAGTSVSYGPEPDLRCWLSRGSQVTHSMPYRYLDLSSILPSFDARKAT